MRIETCQFKRKENSEWEDGVIVNEGDGPIIDMDGKVVPHDPQIWDWRPISTQVMTIGE
jgi:hypothetical protein